MSLPDRNTIDPSILRAADIRGVAGLTLDSNTAELIGKAFGTVLKRRKINKVIVGGDGRLSTPELSRALMKGLLSCGLNVVDIGCCSTPMLYFASFVTYRSAQKKGLPMFTAYEAEMEKSGNEKKAMQASFAAWYESDYYRNYYDQYHKDNIVDSCKDGIKKKQKNLYSKECPAEEVLKSCRYNGEIYMTPEFLNQGKAFSITAEDKKAISSALKRYAAAVGKEPDTSLQSMRERRADGTLLPEKKAVNAAVVAKAKQKGR